MHQEARLLPARMNIRSDGPARTERVRYVRAGVQLSDGLGFCGRGSWWYHDAMDIVAHGLWAATASEAAKGKGTPVRTGWAFFWGVFPDLFAFALPLTWIGGSFLLGNISFAEIPHPHGAYAGDPTTASLMLLAETLYQYSHSAIIFLVIFFCVRMFTGRYRFELGGWGLHILMDIPTHSRAFYPTPVFWPISNWTFDGISWATPWFLITNYALLCALLLFLKYKRKKEVGTVA